MPLSISAARLSSSLFVLWIIASPVQARVAELSDAQAKHFFNAKGCNACHELKELRLGPPYQLVALRYEATMENVDRLAMKVMFGGAGAWGIVPMISNPGIQPGEAQSIARWILRQRPPASNPR